MNKETPARPRNAATDRREVRDPRRGAWPRYAEDEIAAVVDVLRSGEVNQWGGHRVSDFEAAMAGRMGLPHAVAVCNGSVALELALHALAIGPGDEVIVTPMSFIASASCVSLVGATPVFADIDPDTLAIAPEAIAASVGPRTHAIIPVHLAGWPADMPRIMEIAERHDLLVIEDCAQAVGASMDGRPVGSFGHASTLSFCRDKIISTGGEGGMALFRDEAAWKRAWSYKDHGKSRALMDTDPSEPGLRPGFHYVHASIGTNWRMTEMQAAIGLAQLDKLDDWLARRRQNADRWRRAFEDLDCLTVPTPPTNLRHAYYRLYTHLLPERLRAGVQRSDVLSALLADDIPVSSGVCPEIYREKAFTDLHAEPSPLARERGAWMLAFETHPGLELSGLSDMADMAGMTGMAGMAERAAKIIAGFAQG